MIYKNNNSALFFYSPSRDADIYASDLERMSYQELETIEHEISLSQARAKGDLDWIKISSPDQWPDESWPQRVCRYSARLDLFLKLTLQAKKTCGKGLDAVSLKRHNQELMHDLHKKKMFVKMLLMAVEDRYGRGEMLNLKRIARTLAETAK